MAGEHGCLLPDNLYYWPEKHVWAKPLDDGTVLVGMTDVAQSLAGKIVAVSLRSLGRTLARGKSAGTLESGKWVGAIPTPVAGDVVAVNPAVSARPTVINEDPYGDGWLIQVRPSDWDADAHQLVHGSDGVAAYERFLSEQGIRCQPR
jgi:glycine cleavage system H protein